MSCHIKEQFLAFSKKIKLRFPFLLTELRKPAGQEPSLVVVALFCTYCLEIGKPRAIRRCSRKVRLTALHSAGASNRLGG